MTGPDLAVYARLPMVSAPLPGEVLDSYLMRLATRNYLSAHLWPFTAPRDHLLVPVLMTLTARTEKALLSALPELRDAAATARFPHLTGQVSRRATKRPACTRCAARAGTAAPTTVYATHDDLICVPHLRWVGGAPFNCSAAEQFSVNGCRDIVAAHRRHRRLIHRWGRQPVHGRFDDAYECLRYWRQWDTVINDPGIAARRSALGIHADDPPHTAKDTATWYPNVVALTELFLGQDTAISQTGLRNRALLEAGLQHVARHVIAGLRPSGATDPYLHARRTPPLPSPIEVETREHCTSP